MGVPSPGIGEACAALNEARIALEEARQALAYRSGEVPCEEVIHATALAQLALQKALDGARELKSMLKCACHKGSTCDIAHDPAKCTCAQCRKAERGT